MATSILITIPGGPTSNSFVTLEQADDILAAAPFDTTGWDALDDGPKEQRLVLGAQVMGFLPWKGYRAYMNQALCFPRVPPMSDLALTPARDEMGYPYIPDWEAQALANQYGLDALPTVPDIPEVIGEVQVYLSWLLVHPGLVSMANPDDGVDGPQIKSLSLGGFLNVQFASQPLQSNSSRLMSFISVADWAVYAKAMNYLSTWRCVGDGRRPAKLPEITL